jgi:osmotically-inducible protein OsmY
LRNAEKGVQFIDENEEQSAQDVAQTTDRYAVWRLDVRWQRTAPSFQRDEASRARVKKHGSCGFRPYGEGVEGKGMLGMVKKSLLISAVMMGCLAGYSQSSADKVQKGPDDRAVQDSSAVTATSRNETNTTSRIYSSTNSDGSFRKADNTGRNVRDRSDTAVTPIDQGNNKSDLEITRNIRRALSTNDQFSVLAKNIKIMTANGKVVLRGPVETEQEREAVFSAAKSVATGDAVENQLEVKTGNQK